MFREFVVAKQRRDDARDRETTQAWLTANYTRAEKLPKLESQLTRRTERRQTVREQRTVLQMLSAQYDIPLKDARPSQGEPSESA